MASRHPYISSPGSIERIITYLRSTFPSSIKVDTIQKLGIAPKNEYSVINALQFIGLIDETGKANEEKKSKAFSGQNDEEFAEAFSEIIKEAYKDLFDLRDDKAWTLDDDDLKKFFRGADGTGESTGQRQARVFQVFSSLCGKTESPIKKGARKTSPSKKASNKDTPAINKPASAKNESPNQTPKQNSVLDNLGMSIKIEVNLPSEASPEAYDNIFKSIRKHLIDG